MTRLKTVACTCLAIIALFAAGCGGNKLGTHFPSAKCDLYYTSAVTVDEATGLAKFLAGAGWSEQTVQLTKNGNTIEFRVVVKKGMDSDQEAIGQFKGLCEEISQAVFSGQKVDIHMCDDEMNTLRVVVAR